MRPLARFLLSALPPLTTGLVSALVFVGAFVVTVALQPNLTLPEIFADVDKLVTHVVYGLGILAAIALMVVMASPLLAAEVPSWRKAWQWNALAVSGLGAAGIFLVILFHDIL